MLCGRILFLHIKKNKACLGLFFYYYYFFMFENDITPKTKYALQKDKSWKFRNSATHSPNRGVEMKA